MSTLFTVIYSILAFLLITVILLQQKNSSLGSMMGSDAGDEMAQTRRGTDKFLHNATIVLSLLFALGGIGWMAGIVG